MVKLGVLGLVPAELWIRLPEAQKDESRTLKLMISLTMDTMSYPHGSSVPF